MTGLVPDLWAAYGAARHVQDDAQHGAAWFLAAADVGDADWRTGRARECARQAQAARYEALALAAAARGETDR